MNDRSMAEMKVPQYEWKELDIDDIYPDPENRTIYEVDGIEELADSIEMQGLMTSLTVQAADKNGKYRLISGERRWTALRVLAHERRLEKFRYVRCLVENEHDEDLLRLMLIMANATARDMTDAEKMRQAVMLTRTLTKLQSEAKIEGRVRDIVARMLSTSTGQLGRYQAINSNLKNEDLRKGFEDGKIGVSAAYEASRLGETKQEELAGKFREKGKLSLQEISEAKEAEPAYTPLHPKHLEYLEKLMDQVGLERMTPCQRCKIATQCQKCCSICKDPCNNWQECQQDTATAKELLLSEMEELREKHMKQKEQEEEKGYSRKSERETGIVALLEDVISYIERKDQA